MNEILYCIEDHWGNIIAKDMTMDVAMVLARALFDTHFNEECIAYTIKRQKENIEINTTLYAISQKSKSSDKVYYRDFKDCGWKEDIDESCLSSKKQFVEEMGENNWKGNYKIISFDLVANELE